MFKEIFLFEIKYRLKQISTYVYFGIWFFAMFLMASNTPNQGAVGGKVFANSPFGIFDVFTRMMALGIVVISAIFGTSILRDFQEGTYELFFTKPIRKSSYLGGRLLGSMVISVLIFSGLILGHLVGMIMPWAEPSSFMPVHLWFYVEPFLLIAVTDILFAGALFFAIGALTRNIVAVYLQGVIFLVVYLIAGEFVKDTPDATGSFWAALFDPLAIRTGAVFTRYWTISEKNSLVVPFAGVMAYNRLLWLSIGAGGLVAAFRFFRFSTESLAGKRFGKRIPPEPEEQPETSPGSWTAPAIAKEFGPAARWAQFVRLTRLRVSNIMTSLPFAALVLLLVVSSVLDASVAGRMYGTPVFPVTYLMASVLMSSVLMLIVIATIYAGELVWKERDLRFDQIHDALPAPAHLSFLSMITALTTVFAVLASVVILIGVTSQAWKGYFRFQLLLYFQEIVVINLPFLIQYSVAALLLQIALRNKFLGHTVLIGMNLLMIVLLSYGYIDRLYRFGETPTYTYSDTKTRMRTGTGACATRSNTKNMMVCRSRKSARSMWRLICSPNAGRSMRPELLYWRMNPEHRSPTFTSVIRIGRCGRSALIGRSREHLRIGTLVTAFTIWPNRCRRANISRSSFPAATKRRVLSIIGRGPNSPTTGRFSIAIISLPSATTAAPNSATTMRGKSASFRRERNCRCRATPKPVSSNCSLPTRVG